MFRKLFGKRDTKPAAPPLPVTYDDLVARAFAHTQALMEVQAGPIGIAQATNWDVDLQAGSITWTLPDRVIRAPAELIGTWNAQDETFLWGWDHPSAPPGTAIAAAKVKAHADTHGITRLQTGTAQCSFEEGWQLASVAVLAGDLQGVYRGQASDTAWAYIGFGNVSVSAA